MYYLNQPVGASTAAVPRNADIMAGESDIEVPGDRVHTGNTGEQNAPVSGIQDTSQTIEPADELKKDDVEAANEPKDVVPEDGKGLEEARKDIDKPKPSKVKVMWGKLGLDLRTVVMMFKYV